MKVIFHTNIDAYESSHFPEKFDTVPSIGHTVEVKHSMLSFFRNKLLPTKLEVVNINWREDRYSSIEMFKTVAYVELHYRKNDLEFAKLNNVNLF